MNIIWQPKSKFVVLGLDHIGPIDFNFENSWNFSVFFSLRDDNALTVLLICNVPCILSIVLLFKSMKNDDGDEDLSKRAMFLAS